MNWTNIQANATPDLTLDDLMAAVEKLGPPQRALIRVHPLSQGLLRERLRAAVATTDFDMWALGGVPIIEDEYMGLGAALVIKEVFERNPFGVSEWRCEGMQLIKLIDDKDDNEDSA